jgi:hypothetical protein
VTTDEKWSAILAAVQQDVGGRGLAGDPTANLFNACPGDLKAACRSLAEHPAAVLGVVTGFYIPTAGLGETDGPLGAVYLARTLPELGVRVVLASDPFCRAALEAGLKRCDILHRTPVLDLPLTERPGWTHVLALERVGPAHTPESVRRQPGTTEETVRRFLAEVPAEHHGRCHTMRGVDITDRMGDASAAFDQGAVTIGIGDGGNEIGMGKVSWDVIRRNIPGGAVIACRVATDYLIVAGVSNWGAYALACGVALARGVRPPDTWFDVGLEEAILSRMVEQGPLVDGVAGTHTATVDGLNFAEYARPLVRLGQVMGG